ncbi:exported hypothetical protein [Mesorhizobium plurifarium]|uniref:Uncharacterized protein n=1 Tax=Mesorhizobium plurifarium TaxID=69974 RepID=A0A0K2VXI3_MESPL|nr:exported hypothetical protein [Mesorhizobium plurifarium]
MIVFGAVVVTAIVTTTLAVMVAAVMIATIVVAAVAATVMATLSTTVMAAIAATAVATLAATATVALRIGGRRGQLGAVERQMIGRDGKRQRGRSAQSEPDELAERKFLHLFSSFDFGMPNPPLARKVEAQPGRS